jgi:hypothetical protein
MAIEFDRGNVDANGTVLAVVDWEAALTGLQAGRLPCSGSEAAVLRLAASIAEGMPVDVGSALCGLDERNAALVAAAVLHAAGQREAAVGLAAGGPWW